MSRATAWKSAAVFCFSAAMMLPNGTASADTNFLFYGNSFTNASNGVPFMFKAVAQADGQIGLNVENAAVNSQSLGWHLANNTSVISNPVDFSETPGFQWNYVVMQEYSTKPTNITYSSLGDPAAFKADAQSLYNTVKAHSTGVMPVLFETWSRSPQNTVLNSYYPGPGSLHDKANQMQSELHTYYTQAHNQIGGLLAPVGDAFQSTGFDDSLYSGDWYHENGKGALLAAMVIYNTIYGEQTSDISYTAITAAMHNAFNINNLDSYGIYNASMWSALTSVADQAVPEPASGLLLGSACLLMVRRRRGG